MRITESASNAILNTMASKGLDPNKTYLEIGIFDGNLGISFTRDKMGRELKIGDLTVIVSGMVDSNGIIVDFGEVDGKKGLIFLGESSVDQYH